MENGGFTKGATTLIVAVPFAVVSTIGGMLYKSIDDRIEVRRRDQEALLLRVNDAEGKVARNIAQIEAMREQLQRVEQTMRDIHLRARKADAARQAVARP